jgi:MFS family permease
MPLALLPLVTVESLGLKRFGTLSGLANFAQTVGAMLGPVIAGRVFDVTRRYTVAFELFIATLLIGAAALFACLPLTVDESQPQQQRQGWRERIARPAVANSEKGLSGH